MELEDFIASSERQILTAIQRTQQDEAIGRYVSPALSTKGNYRDQGLFLTKDGPIALPTAGPTGASIDDGRTGQHIAPASKNGA